MPIIGGHEMKRRDLLKSLPFAAGAVVMPTTVALALPAAQAASLSEMAAIPLDTYEAITAWQTAHRASVRAAKAYSDQLRVTGDNCRHVGRKWSSPEDAEACTLRWREYVELGKEVEIARERMIYALLKV
jgi:hypothetical protein